MLDVRELSVSLGGKPIVKSISFKAQKGDIIAFLGPNGAGKTTCMRLLSGVFAPQRGEISLYGLNSKDLARFQSKIGFLPEAAPLYGQMKVKEFLEFIAAAKNIDRPKDAIIEAASLMELKDVFHNIIDTLSKGFRRRIAMASAIIGNPQLLILDEPTDGLDPNQKAKMRETFTSFAKETIIIISTHILDEMIELCNRVILFDKGEIKIDESAQDFKARNNGDIEKTFRDFTLKDIENARV